jgi:hypothetical protein
VGSAAGQSQQSAADIPALVVSVVTLAAKLTLLVFVQVTTPLPSTVQSWENVTPLMWVASTQDAI